MDKIGTPTVQGRDSGRRDERVFLASLVFVAIVTIVWFAVIGLPTK